jgi:hypothetical protein
LGGSDVPPTEHFGYNPFRYHSLTRTEECCKNGRRITSRGGSPRLVPVYTRADAGVFTKIRLATELTEYILLDLKSLAERVAGRPIVDMLHLADDGLMGTSDLRRHLTRGRKQLIVRHDTIHHTHPFRVAPRDSWQSTRVPWLCESRRRAASEPTYHRAIVAVLASADNPTMLTIC